eukprot:m.26637 g.26637  ORF g.26637 m.26637 type:complete len:50 (+) comp6334_c0_seq1:94-243(+)
MGKKKGKAKGKGKKKSGGKKTVKLSEDQVHALRASPVRRFCQEEINKSP